MSGTGLSLGEPCWSWRSCDSSNWCRRMYQSIENLGNRRLDGSSLILEGQGQRRCVISKNDEGSFEISEPPGWRRWSHARCRSTQSVYLTCLWLFQQTMGLMKLRRANSTHSVMQLGAELSGEQAKTQNTKYKRLWVSSQSSLVQIISYQTDPKLNVPNGFQMIVLRNVLLQYIPIQYTLSYNPCTLPWFKILPLLSVIHRFCSTLCSTN